MKEAPAPTQVIARNSLWVALDTVVGFVCSLISSIAVARGLGPAKLGYYSYVVWLVMSTGSLATLGVPAATRKYLAELLGAGKPGVCRRILRLTSRWQLLIATAVTAVGSLVVFAWVPLEHRAFTILAVLSLWPNMVMGVLTAANMAIQDFAANVWASLISTVLTLGGVLLALYCGWGLVGLTASMLTGRSVDLLVRYGLYKRRFCRWLVADLAGEVEEREPGLEKDLRRRIWRFCAQSSLLQGLNLVVWDRSEMIFLKQFSDVRQMAFYSISFTISQQLLLLPQVFAAAAGSNLMWRVGREPTTVGPMAATMLRYVALITLPLTFGVAAMSGPLVRILYGKQYLPVIPVLALLAIFAGAKALMMPAQQLLVACDRQDFLLKCTVAMAVVNIILDLLLIPSNGAFGGAIANSIAQTAAAASTWAFAALRLGAPVPGRDLLKMMLSAGLMAAAAAGAAFLMPPVPAVATGVPLGAACYVLLLRWTGSLHAQDRQRLGAVESQLPRPLRGLYRKSLRFVAP